MSRWTAIWLAFLACLAVPRLADACSCHGWADVEAMAQRAPLVLVGRITATGDVRHAGPRWADFSVEAVVKGRLTAKAVRIWDPWAESDCGGLLDIPRLGQLLVVTLTSASAGTPDQREVWSALGLTAPPDDLVIHDGVCQEPLKVLASTRDQRRWMRRHLK
jgi:hypothetical protein